MSAMRKRAARKQRQILDDQAAAVDLLREQLRPTSMADELVRFSLWRRLGQLSVSDHALAKLVGAMDLPSGRLVVAEVFLSLPPKFSRTDASVLAARLEPLGLVAMSKSSLPVAPSKQAKAKTRSARPRRAS